MGLEREVPPVTVYSACSGVARVTSGELAPTAMQYPVRMASLGVEAVVAFARSGRRPRPAGPRSTARA